MPEPVVDAFEVVNIEKGDGKRSLLLASEAKMELDQFHSAAAGQSVDQGIMAGPAQQGHHAMELEAQVRR